MYDVFVDLFMSSSYTKESKRESRNMDQFLFGNPLKNWK